MYCEECGAKNKENSKFCENCGHEIKIESKEKNNEMKKNAETVKQPMNKKNKIIIAVVAVVIVLFVTIYIILSNKAKPQNVAENYFDAVVNYDADKIYSYVDVKDSDFTTKEMFKKVIKNAEKLNEKKITNYKIVRTNVDSITAKVKFDYVVEDSEKSKDITIYLTKNKKKKWLLFDNWQVTNKKYVDVKNYKIRVFKDSKLSVEGKKVDKKYIDKSLSTSTIDVYKMPAMFAGYYNIQVKTPMGIEIKDQVGVSSYSSYTCKFDVKSLSSSFKKKLTNNIKESLQTLYDSAKDNKSFDEIKDKFNYKKANLNDLKSDYETLVTSLSTSSSKLKSIKFDKIDISSIRMDNSKGYLYVNAKVNYDYNIEYQLGEETKQKTDDSYSYVYMYFDYVDSNFKLVDVSRLNSYFSRY